MSNLRIDARMALANYESSYAVFGADASFTMKEVHVVREYIDTLEAALQKIVALPLWEEFAAIPIARAALEGKDAKRSDA